MASKDKAASSSSKGKRKEVDQENNLEVYQDWMSDAQLATPTPTSDPTIIPIRVDGKEAFIESTGGAVRIRKDKSRLIWTDDLQKSFHDALENLRHSHVAETPKEIQRLMKMDGHTLTCDQVRSRLQKHRRLIQQASVAAPNPAEQNNVVCPLHPFTDDANDNDSDYDDYVFDDDHYDEDDENCLPNFQNLTIK